MSHPKNSTSNTPAQQPEFETDRFASRQTGFWLAGDRCMFQVTTECTAGDVLKQSSALMASTISVFTALSDHDQVNDATAYSLLFLLESAKAMLDAGTYGIEFEEPLREGGAA
ncbi:hypothetical protein RirG_011450 [Rhizophagus irregularis DAOM 197198w]|uniref:DUF3077 domain-containing protein n=1 Tax=Rhizophagus irregularis (strain DAOM 197198w) TaxID=1432141 RepID=A0A015M1G9_RHIIW|nr:hypothetical protein RirG_011450 [Rhizophagus irregularis DAOM 197198w]